jgi:hypothetical protein
MRPQMKRSVWVVLSMVLLSGCAHLEVPRGGLYPFRAEFAAHGKVRGADLSVNGAIVLASAAEGTIQVYGPGGMATGTIDITPEGLVARDMWGRVTDVIDVPLQGIVGLVAGDVPPQAYLYRCRIEGGTKVVYHWGSLCIDDAFLPSEVHVPGEKDLHIDFKPSGGRIGLEVHYGPDTLWISLDVIQGGRWISS